MPEFASGLQGRRNTRQAPLMSRVFIVFPKQAAHCLFFINSRTTERNWPWLGREGSHQHLICNYFQGNCISVQCGGQNPNIMKLKYSQVSQRILRSWSTQIGMIGLIISVKLLSPSTDLL